MSGESEEWRPVVGHESSYEVSSHGRVRGKTRRVPCKGGKTRQIRERIIWGTINPDGYRIVDLNNKKLPVHLLVLFAFSGPRPFASAQGRHINGVRLDCRVENLAWGTGAENAADREAHGNTVRGERVRGARLNAQAVTAIWFIATRARKRASLLARLYNMPISSIYNIRDNRSWRHVVTPLVGRFQ